MTFATYRRRQVFANPEIRERCAKALLETAQRNAYRVYALAIMPDHVHVVVANGSMKHAAPKIINNLKGVAARRVFQSYPELKLDLGSNHLWADEYQAKPLQTATAVQRAVHYVEQNPEEIGWPKQE
jgi:REP element-mobilizing transposase RayT